MLSRVLATIALAGAATAYTNVSTVAVTTTKVVNSIVTYCPEPTDICYNNKTIHVTAATSLSIVAECPCTLTETTSCPAIPYSTTELETVPIHTTYCPSETVISQPSKVYSASEGETLTISNYVTPAVKVLTPGVPVTKTSYTTKAIVTPSYTTVVASSGTFTVSGPASVATYTATAAGQTVTVTNGPFTTSTTIPTTVVSTPGPAPTAPAAPEQPKQPAPPAPSPFLGKGTRTAVQLGSALILGLGCSFAVYTFA